MLLASLSSSSDFAQRGDTMDIAHERSLRLAKNDVSLFTICLSNNVLIIFLERNNIKMPGGNKQNVSRKRKYHFH